MTPHRSARSRVESGASHSAPLPSFIGLFERATSSAAEGSAIAGRGGSGSNGRVPASGSSEKTNSSATPGGGSMSSSTSAHS
jgi:hypothetical protein